MMMMECQEEAMFGNGELVRIRLPMILNATATCVCGACTIAIKCECTVSAGERVRV